MRHQKLDKKFGRNKAQRKELIRSLVRALFIFHRIETTVEKAKESKRLAEKLITRGKKATLSDIRAINRVLRDRSLTKKLLDKLAPLFKEINGGYTRIIRCGFRRGDGASLAILELTKSPAVEKKPKKEKPAKPAKEEKPTEALPAKEEPKAKEVKAEKVKPEEKKKPKEVKPAPEKKGFFGKFKGFFKKGK